jgi:hypothetical protein
VKSAQKPKPAAQIKWMGTALLAGASCILIFIQTQRLLPLIDWSYLVENSYRLSLGQTPYVDFGLVLTPLNYLIDAFFMKLIGITPLAQWAHMWLMQIVTLLLVRAIVLRFGYSRAQAWWWCLPVVLSGYVILPMPLYDTDAMAFMLLALWAALRWSEKSEAQTVGASLLTGATLSLAFLTKQNIGGAFLAFTGLALVSVTVTGQSPIRIKSLLGVIVGAIVPLLMFAGWLVIGGHGLSALEQFVFWCFASAARAKQGFGARILDDYLSWDVFAQLLIWGTGFTVLLGRSRHKRIWAWVIPLASWVIYPWLAEELLRRDANMAGLAAWVPLLVASLLIPMVAWQRDHTLHKRFVFMIPLIFCVTIHATFLSQAVVGSTYGVFAFLVVSFAALLQLLQSRTDSQNPTRRTSPDPNWCLGFALALSAFLAFYNYGMSRMNYFYHDGALTEAMSPTLKGLQTPGPWLRDFDELAFWVRDHIPATDRVVALPGEDPFYSTTGREPALPLFQMNIGTFPHPVTWMSDQILQTGVNWVIVKKRLQSPGGFLNIQPVIDNLQGHFSNFQDLHNYVILKRIP